MLPGAPEAAPNAAEDEPKAATGPEDKIRKDLVQVFFGLVLTQIAVYITSLVDIWDGGTWNYWAAWTHIVLAFFLATTSWFGWQMSVRKAQLHEEASIFQGGFILSLLDILLVGLYFLLVHQVEMAGVAAFPTNPNPTLTAPNAKPEVWIILIVFVIYVVWDTASWRLKEKDYGPWPSVVCSFLVLLALFPLSRDTPRREHVVIAVDVYLICIVFLFRAFKRLQKWNSKNRKNSYTFRWCLMADPSVKNSVRFCLGITILVYAFCLALPVIAKKPPEPAQTDTTVSG